MDVFDALTPLAAKRLRASAVGAHAQAYFDRLRVQGYPSARLHDLRHTFAVRRLQRWREDGQSIEHALFWLCTYLGHASISDTYWYLTGVPELMAAIGERFEHTVRGSAP